MFGKIISFLDNIFITKEKPNTIFSEKSIRYVADCFKSHSSYSQKDLNFFKSIFGRTLLLDNKEITEHLIEAFLLNLKEKRIYQKFFFELVWSSFKSKKYKHISSILYILNQNHISFYNDNEFFAKNLNKIFYYSMTDYKLIQILLNSYSFNWISQKSFNFDSLILPLIISSVKNKNYNMYNSITNSLNYKANYTNRKVRYKSSFAALESNDLVFFKECKHSIPVLNDNLDRWNEEEVKKLLIKSLNIFIKNNNICSSNSVLNIINERNIKLISYCKYSHSENKHLIDNITYLKDSKFLETYLNKINNDLLHSYDDNETIYLFKEQLFSVFNNINNHKINNLFDYLFLPKEDFICSFFKNNYKTDSVFLDFIFEKFCQRGSIKSKILKICELIKVKNKFNDF